MDQHIAADPGARQPTLKRDGVEAYLSERAPVAVGDGPDAAENAAARIVRKIGPLFARENRVGSALVSSFEGMDVGMAMIRHWLPRCQPPFHEDALWDVIETERLAYERAQARASAARAERIKASEDALHQRLADKAAAAEAAEMKRQANARAVKELVLKLKTTPRHARRLLAEKTTLPGVAAQIAEVLGTQPSEHLRRRTRTGRRANLMASVLRPYIAGASWSDFIESPPELGGPVLELRNAFAAAYGSGELVAEHLTDLEAVSSFAHSVGTDADASVTLWNLYKPWRLERFLASALDEVADPYDFG